MKNMKKLVALFAATVMTMSFGVSAFAATVETTVEGDGDATESFNLVFTAPTGGEADVDQLTMIAYLVDDETTLETWEEYDGSQTIVAMDQIGGDEVFGSVPVDVAKLEEGYSIAVAIGGSDVAAANVYKALVTYTTAPQIVAYAITYELGDGTATGNPTESNSDETIAEFFARVVTTPEKEGHTFKHWSKTADGEAINTASTDKMTTLLDDPAGTTVTLYAVYEQEAGPIITVYIGDVNGDKKVNASDAALIKGYAAKYTTNQKNTYNTNNSSNIGTVIEFADGDSVVVGDVNGDKKANASDAALIKGYAAKYTTNQKNTYNTNNSSNIGAQITKESK